MRRMPSTSSAGSHINSFRFFNIQGNREPLLCELKAVRDRRTTRCAIYTRKSSDEGLRMICHLWLRNAVLFDSTADQRPPAPPVVPCEAVPCPSTAHNFLLIGPPGEGKSLLASALPGILPKLTDDEKVELTRIYSAAGELKGDGQVVNRRPMRSVHHSTSKQALVGGGSPLPRPGEATLAHLGALFLDELAEFSGATLETLRQPIEDGRISVSRVGGTLEFPCRFTVVAAMNPCPCGYFGTDRCRCTANDVRRYQGRISGPLLDRLDLQVELNRLTTEERFAPLEPDSSPALRARVEAARQRQRDRFRDPRIPCNAAIPGGRVIESVRFAPAGLERFKQVIDTEQISTRSMDRLAKVARTAADLAESDEVQPPHVEEAASFVVGGVLREASV